MILYRKIIREERIKFFHFQENQIKNSTFKTVETYSLINSELGRNNHQKITKISKKIEKILLFKVTFSRK